MMAHSTFVALSYSISTIVFLLLIIAIISDGKRQKKKLMRLEALNATKRTQNNSPLQKPISKDVK